MSIAATSPASAASTASAASAASAAAAAPSADTRAPAEWSAAVLASVEAELEAVLPGAAVVPARLHEAMRYAVLQGGKRVRPLLAFAAGALSDAPAARLARAGVAVELIHAYSLVHDDMPCMDDDVLRRGKPTVHVAFDEATALLVGDALQSLAFTALSAPGLFADARAQLGMVHLLGVASGSAGMAGGQAIDLQSVGVKLSRGELEAMHRAKTGALLRAAILLGASCGDVPPDAALQAALEQYAAAVGLAFQVVDDILDVETDSAVLGKTAGKDALQDKPTYVSILGLEPARALARDLHGTALAALAPYGAAARRLAELADFIVFRKF